MEIQIKKLHFISNLFKKIIHLLILLFFTVSTILLLNSEPTENLRRIRSLEQCPDNKIKKNIVFLKTHKCASSSIQNIFLRFGFNHKPPLKFVLPNKGNYLGHPQLFTHTFVPYGKYNILTHHTRLNYAEMNLIMPNDTVYITILRNPVIQFESMYNYYNLDKFYNFNFKKFNSLNLTKLPDMNKRFANRIGLNQMFFDLGFDLKNSAKINYLPYIKYLDSVFDLVMIEEFMDESLILLKNLLCWSFDDLITFKLNARINKQEIGELAIKRIKELNKADVELYDYFLTKFKLKLDNLTDLKDEVNQLRERRKYWFDLCVDKNKMKANLINKSSNIVQFDNRKLDDSIKLNKCKFLTSKEIELTNLVRDNQIKFYPNSVYKPFYNKIKSFLINKKNN